MKRLAAAVAEHPEVCEFAEALVAEVVGAPVSERCDRSGSSSGRARSLGEGGGR